MFRTCKFFAFVALVNGLFFSTLKAQVTAGFTVNYPTLHCNPVNISFTNTSTGAGTLTYKWNFGVNTGVNSTFTNPSTTYNNCGTFNVKLIATNSLAQSDSITIPVTIFCKPVAALNVSASSGCIPLNVQFIDNSTPGSGTISSRFWDYGDGNTGTGDTAVHPYTIAGCKNVTLIVKDVNGCQDDTTYNQLVCVNVKPTASFTSTVASSCSAPFSITYNSTSTGKSPLSYSWIFTGGTPSTSTTDTTVVVYNTPGIYDVKLVVTDSSGCTDTTVQHNFAAIASHVVDIQSLGSTTGCAPFKLAVLGVSTPPPLSWSWTTSPAGIPATANTQDTTFLFTEAGNYQVCLTVGYSGGCTASKCTSVKVNGFPKAAFTFSGNVPACAPPLNITYHDSSVGTNLIYRWSFPGGTPSFSDTASPPVITYVKCGANGASLIVTNTAGCSDTFSVAQVENINCPSASFEGAPNVGCGPLTVNFDNAGTTGTPDFWQWNFGDIADTNSVQSTQQNPSHTYTNVGCYNVRLITGNSKGCIDTLMQKNYVCVGTPPTPNFTATPTVTCAYHTVSFTSATTGADSSASYQWDFTHNPPFKVQSTARNPSYLYQDTGFFDVTLVVCNFGCCDTLQIDSFVHILPPIASVMVERSCSVPLQVTLHGNGSIGADAYLWVAPGGVLSSSTDSTTTVTYPASGSYEVSLIVTNNASGCTDTMSVTVDIHRVQADFYTTDSVVCNPASVCFVNTSQSGAGYIWSIINEETHQVITSTSQTPCFTLANPDFYDVKLKTKDVYGCVDSIRKNHYVTVHGLNLAFKGDRTTGCVPLTVNFSSTVTSLTSSLVSVEWNFGDSLSGALDSSIVLSPSHTYNVIGLYSVTLASLDNYGCEDTLLKPQFVVPYKPVADFVALDTNICLGKTACFFNNSIGNSLGYKWDLGDGITLSQANPCHLYTAVGNYTVSLIAANNSGCADTMIKPLYIHVLQTHAALKADSVFSSCPPLPVKFTNLTTGIDTFATFNWLFGDGSNSNVKNPFHIYNHAGYFNVTLIATNRYGCTDTIVYDSLIVISGPAATYKITPTAGCNPLNVCFVATSLTPTSFAWDFGDGNVLRNATDSVCYLYKEPGVFHPALILDDGKGCTYSYSIDSVIVGGPIVVWHPSTLNLCKSGSVQFTDSSTSVTPIIKRIWTFGDTASGALDSSKVQNPTHAFNTVGNYIITLTLTNKSGCSSSFSDTVKVTPGPLIFIKATPASVCEKVPIVLSDSIVSVSKITEVQWNFGDPASGADNSSTQPSPSHTYNLPDNYVVTLIAQAQNNCSDTSTLSIPVLSNPVIGLTPTSAICPGDTTQLNASGGTRYSWSPTESLDDFNIANPSAFPATTVTYTVTVTNSNNCSSVAMEVVSIRTPPVILATAIGKDSVCKGTTAQLSGSGGVSYTWQPDSLLNNANIQKPLATINAASTFTVIGKDANGCTGTDFVSVSVLPLPITQAGGDTGVCIGNGVQLTGTPSDSVFWRPEAGLNNSNIANPIASPMVTTTYAYATVDLENHCVGHDTVVVTVHPLPAIDAGNDEAICLGLSKQLNATGGLTYIWTPATYLNNAAIGSPTCTPLANIFYTVTGTDVFGCVNTDSLAITIRTPANKVVSNDTLICGGQPVQLNASGGITYSWVPPTGLSDANIPNPLATPAVTTTYILTINDSICQTTSKTTVIVTVSELPVAYAGPDGTVLAGEPYQIKGSATGTIAWTPSDNLSCTDCERPIATPLETTTYTLVATNADGCLREDQVTVIVLCNGEVIYIPNAFSPNGNGKNDVFKIRSNGIKKLAYLRVYDRWGELVFETSDIDEGWDGTFRGTLLPPAVYVYYLNALCGNGDKIKKQGNVTLVR